MSKLSFCTLFLAALLVTGANAQQQLRFRSSEYIGLLLGETGNSLELHSVNGLVSRNWFAGIGLGYDRYRQESYPFYLSVSRQWLFHRISWQATIDGGANIGHFEPGIYGRTGIGVQLGQPEFKRFLLDFGYSMKQYKESKSYTSPCLIGPCPETTERYNYKMRRLSLRMGYRF